jgi:DNA-directed RNA polymerase specialized sigma24 family protein
MPDPLTPLPPPAAVSARPDPANAALAGLVEGLIFGPDGLLPAMLACGRGRCLSEDETQYAILDTVIDCLAGKVRALEEAHTNPNEVRGILFRVFRNKAVTQVRRRRPAESLGGGTEPADTGPNPADEAAAREEMDLLDGWLRARLSNRDRQAVVLWSTGVGDTEVAAAIGVSKDNARKIISRALVELRAAARAAAGD